MIKLGKYFVGNIALKRFYLSYFRFYNSTLTYEIDLKVNDVSLNKYIQHLQQKYQDISSLQVNRDVQQSLSKLQPIMDVLAERRNIEESLQGLKKLLVDEDKDIKALAYEEKSILEKKITSIDTDLIELLLPNDKEDACTSIMLEVHAGVGGQEAMLFADELFHTYCNFAKYEGWTVCITDYAVSESGGIRHAVAFIKGPSVFQYFKYEAGVHRVQRVPATEKSGRLHTSTVSVIALPQPDDIEIDIRNKDLHIDTKRASGAGGQHVNTTDSAVRITHIPSGISVECQVDRSQIKNKSLAMQKLRAKLYQQKLGEHLEDMAATRKSQVKSNFRNEKIRTYNFNQDRITDHRLQNANLHNLKEFLIGGESLEQLIKKLHTTLRKKRLVEIVNNLDET